MSDAKQPEPMRPIPDGGLKDAMPSWLKRPPAWRDLPTAEQRHERSLPEPDTSEIDPRSLVDVSDLPKWLQAIAARGDIPVPTPDAAVEHAVEVVQSAQKPVPVQPEPEREADPVPGLDDQRAPAPVNETGIVPEPTPSSSATIPPASGRLAVPVWTLPVAAVVIVVLMVMLFVLI